MLIYGVILVIFVTNPAFADIINQCENTTLYLSCPDNYKLNIGDVFYGQDAEDICPDNANPSSANCSSNTASDTINNLCQGQNNCTIYINSTVLGEPCPNSTNVLRINYDCINPATGCGKYQHNATDVCNCADRCSTPGIACAQFCPAHSCVCDKHFLKDSLTNTCVLDKYCPQNANLSVSHEVYSDCANCQKTCRHQIPDQICYGPHIICLPGYACESGYVRDDSTGNCVIPAECTRCKPRW